MTESTTRTTGNDPVEGLDPGGTHSTKPGNPDKSGTKAGEAKTTPTVVSGDQNAGRPADLERNVAASELK